jgi:hypothetical protein
MIFKMYRGYLLRERADAQIDISRGGELIDTVNTYNDALVVVDEWVEGR